MQALKKISASVSLRWLAVVISFVISFCGLSNGFAAEADGTVPDRNDPLYQSTGDHARSYFFTDADQPSPYRLYVPKNWAPGQHMPLVVILHGGGGNQNGPFDQTPQGMGGILQRQAEQRGWIILSPYGYYGGWGSDLPLPPPPPGVAPPGSARQLPPDGKGLPATDDYSPAARRSRALGEKDVMNVVRRTMAEYQADPQRIYLMGNSGGSIGTMFLARQYPELWAAIAPSNGPVQSETFAFERLKGIAGAYVIHGELDTLTSEELMRKQADQIRLQGIDTKYINVPGANHGSAFYVVLDDIFDFFARHPRREAAPLDKGPASQCKGLNGFAIPASAFGLPTGGAVVTSAAAIAAKPETTDAKGNRSPAMVDYCKVLGEIRPVDPQAPTIEFQVNLPFQWNQKAMQMGGGGSNGVIPRSVATATGSPLGGTIAPDVPNPLARGYVTLGSDSGHRISDDNWYASDEAITNFAYGQLKKTHDAAIALMQNMYGQKPRLFYYFGFSQGGREALEVAQRFPADYDGVFSQAPVLYFGVALNAVLRENFQLEPGTWLPPAKAGVIAREVLRQCDALDGLKDGVINNYLACNKRFDPELTPLPYAAVRCKDGQDTGNDCLSDLQIATANRLRGPVHMGFPMTFGIEKIPGFGTGLEDNKWELLAQEQPSAQKGFAGNRAGALVRITIANDKALDLHRFRPQDYRASVQSLAAKMDTSNADLSPFFKRGGKLIFKSHASDYAANPRALEDYYQRVVARLGEKTVNQFIRYYVTPNADHGGAGKSASGQDLPQYVDVYTMLEDWVEKGKVPADAPVQTSKPDASGKVSSRPMCRYPAYPRYKGSGDAAFAASYVCSK